MSENTIPSGEEVINDFFNKLASIPEIEHSIAKVFKKLHDEGNLSKQSILNALEALREGGSS